MTSDNRLALARAFVGLQERLATWPVMPVHPIIKRHRVTTSRRGTHLREEKYIAE